MSGQGAPQSNFSGITQGTFQGQQVTLGLNGGDDCHTPDVLAGTGVWAFDTTAATTGIDGQNEALCAVQYGSTVVDHDVWYTWTAPSSGLARMTFCGGTGADTKVAAYGGSGCPVAGTALACNDDTCGFQSQIAFLCTGGNTYTLQVGSFPGANGGFGAFQLTVSIPAVNDDCSTATPISGTGNFSFDNSGASTGAQQGLMCGQGQSFNDVWFDWTCTATGIANVSLCGLSGGFDSVIAAYAGSGCPAPGSALICDDDSSCGLESTIVFACTSGNHYMLQIGSFDSSYSTSTGGFSVNVVPPPSPCQIYDDGTTENLGSLAGSGDIIWVTRFGAPGLSTTINSIDQMWGSLMWAAYTPPNGTPTNVLVYQDGVSQDGDPTDATLVLDIPSVVTNGSTDTYVNYPIAPLAITGYFFVGAEEAYTNNWVVPMDQTSITYPPANYIWGNNAGGVADLVTPSNNLFPPTAATPFYGFDSYFCTRVNCSFGPATYLCDPGSAGTISCPCANPPSGSGRGCDNSSGTGGASITGAGNNSLGTPTLAFTSASEKPTATSILLQGTTTNATGLVFGQGVRCAAGVLKRLYVKAASGGSITAPNFGLGDLDIPTRSGNLGDPISSGQMRTYMVYYRDPTVLGGCSGFSTFNATNTAQVTWQP